MNRTAFLLVLALCATPVLADDVQLTPERPKFDPGALSAYTEYDQNGDGVVTMPEAVALAPAEISAEVAKCDTDGNGLFSQAEYDFCQYGTLPEGTPSPAR